jgi:hypothetical protein
MVGFGVSSVEPLASTARELGNVSLSSFYFLLQPV